MQDPLDIETKALSLQSALEKHLGVKGRTLQQSLRRAGRRLPKRLRGQAALVAQAQDLQGNIKLTRQFDVSAIEHAYTEVSEYLAKIDRSDARRARVISVLAVLAFNFILMFAAIVIYLRMRGTI
ncbi:MAG: hypothetical protein R8G34_19635 [Paracoccaceae bacterium]|nr:hypothetical protein [Paracoccaceae bacterium]